MKIVVAGLWHLGSVTSACLAEAGFDVIGFDDRASVLDCLKQGKAPVFEPGLDALLQKNMQSQKLHWTHDLTVMKEADIIWVTFDTPVDDQGKADVDFVLNHIRRLFPHVKPHALMLISSQLPVGTTQQVEEEYRQSYQQPLIFGYSPENLRLGSAIPLFTHPDRVVIGVNDAEAKMRLTALFKPFTDRIMWMSCASAEMTKHAINAFLANSVVFANEIAQLCAQVGACAREVEEGLKSESRIGPLAYLRAGSAFAGGTLSRDLRYLIDLGYKTGVDTTLFPAIMASNEHQKQWVHRQMERLWPDLRGKQISVLGLTYKSQSNTLVGSAALALCAWLSSRGARVSAYEPMLDILPQGYEKIVTLQPSLKVILDNMDAMVITKKHGLFEELSAMPAEKFKNVYIFDESGFYREHFLHHAQAHYICLGGVS